MATRPGLGTAWLNWKKSKKPDRLPGAGEAKGGGEAPRDRPRKLLPGEKIASRSPPDKWAHSQEELTGYRSNHHESSSDESSMGMKGLSIEDGIEYGRTKLTEHGTPLQRKRSPQGGSQHGSKRLQRPDRTAIQLAPNQTYDTKVENGDNAESNIVPSFSLSKQSQSPIVKKSSPASTTSTVDYGVGDLGNRDIRMLRQPVTRAITKEQLVNEVKGIYAGLVMVEKKCIEVCAQQHENPIKELADEQWQALIALHRTLLHEHHDFFLASQHPTAIPDLRGLAAKYAMPARMWRHGIHTFLELLRSRLPESLDHMLSFVYLAYSMMALLLESVPSFTETWIECLGDLARYRMAIEEADMRDREIWAGVARMWYHRAADRSPYVGRIQHHLAVLARPDVIQQLFLYSKALISVVPFLNTRDSIMLLFSPFLEKADITYPKYLPVESSLVTAFGTLFTKGSIQDFTHYMDRFMSGLARHIEESKPKPKLDPKAEIKPDWRTRGPEVVSCLVSGIFDFGNAENTLWTLTEARMKLVKDLTKNAQEAVPASTDEIKAPGNLAANFVLNTSIMESLRRKDWESHDKTEEQLPGHKSLVVDSDMKFKTSDDVSNRVLPYWARVIVTVSSRTDDKFIMPFMHTTLATLWSMSFIPGALKKLEAYVPWIRIAKYLNTLGRSSISIERIESGDFPLGTAGSGQQLPEDFPLRGLIWAAFYFPTGFFKDKVADEDERTHELESHTPLRTERCLWLGVRIASLGRYLKYDAEAKQFSATEFAASVFANTLEPEGNMPHPGEIVVEAEEEVSKAEEKTLMAEEETLKSQEVAFQAEKEDLADNLLHTAEEESDYELVDVPEDMPRNHDKRFPT